MPLLHYQVVDVFTTQVLEGNPLAVFTDASQIDELLMQKIAREMNLAETSFVLPSTNPACTARVRIFTPQKEMIFAGHPTIGTGFVLLSEGRVPPNTKSFLLEEKVGPVPIWVEQGERTMLWLRTPSISEGKQYDPPCCAQALGLEANELLPLAPQLLSAGNPTLLVALKSKAAVDRAWLHMQGMKGLQGADAEPFCVFVFSQTEDGAYSRMFAPAYGIPEDPATGSSTGPLAAYMMKHRMVNNAAGTCFLSEQGAKMGRRSLLHVRIAGPGGVDGIFVGGHVTPIAKGTMKL